MLEAWKTLIENQYEAALCTIGLCVERCSPAIWDVRVGNHPYCRLAFHTLFFTDYYLGENEAAFRSQPFHIAHPGMFRDYEELIDREPVRSYERPQVLSYLGHCREKAAEVTAAETVETLAGPSGFARGIFAAELHVYSIRHIQHHAAQLSLRLRLDAAESIPWVGSGWLE